LLDPNRKSALKYQVVRDTKAKQVKKKGRPKGKSEGPRENTLGGLERKYFADGGAAAADLFSKVYLRPMDENYYVHLRFDGGTGVTRTDATEDVRSVEYEHFDPPTFWQNPFQIMRVYVNDKKPTKFYFHDGEELIIPIEGPGILYDFFWSEPGTGSVPKLYPSEPCVVRVGSASRIEPQIPHRAWNAGKTQTRAWMITHPLANAAAQIYISGRDLIKNQASSRTVEEKSLREYVDVKKKKSGQYSLIAWGISEAIRQKRLRSNKSLEVVAKRCEIDPAHLSKIEKHLTNVGLDTLIRIFDFLDLDIAAYLAQPRQIVDVVKLASEVGCFPIFNEPPERIRIVEDPVESTFPNHSIHPQLWLLEPGAPVPPCQIKSQWSSAWIMISGRAVVQLSAKDWNGKSEILEPESVLHLRGGGPSLERIEPLEKCVLLQVVFDPEQCRCGKNGIAG
jgi:transcriptional regulator with XRE-family HTH domain